MADELRIDSVQIKFRGPDGMTYVADAPTRQEALAAIAAEGGKVIVDNIIDNPLGREQTAVEGMAFMRGMEDLGEDVLNTVRRPFQDPVARLETLVEQAIDSKKERDEIARREANLEAVGGRAFPGLARAIPRAVAEVGAEVGLTRNVTRPLTRILAGAGVSGAFEGLDASEETAAGMASRTAQGAGVGLIAGTIFELPAATARFVSPELVQALKARGKLASVDPFHMTDDSRQAGIRLTPAEALGGDRLRRQYRQAGGGAGAPKERFEQAQGEDVQRVFASIADNLLPAGVNRATPTQRVRTALEAGRNALDGAVRDLYTNASKEFNRLLAPAIARAGARTDAAGRIVGGQRVIPSKNLEQELQSQIAAAQERNLPAASLRPLQERLARVRGGWTLGGYQAELSEIGNQIYAQRRGGAASVLDQRATFDERRIREAMLKDLEDGIMGLQGNAATRDVAMSLRDARDAFRQNMEEVNYLEGQAIDRLLGGDAAFTGDEFTKRFFSLESDAQIEVMRFLDRTRPEAADGLRGVIFNSAVERARGRKPNPDPDGPQLFDLDEFLKVFGNMNAAEQGMMLPRLRPGERVRVGAGLRVLKTLTESPGRLAEAVGGAKGPIQRMEQFAINFVLRNPGFVARLIAGELSPHHLERMFYTPEGLRAFMELGKPNLTRQAKAAAISSLINQAVLAEIDVQDLKFAAEQAAAEAEMQQRGAQPGMVPGL